MNSIQGWLDAYGKSHQNPINKKIHWLCVPLIMLSLLGLLWSIKLSFIIDSEYLNATTLLISLVSIYYFRLSVPMGIGMLFISILMLFLIFYINHSNVSLFIYLVIFVLAWIGQFIGHKIEGEKPSFFEDLQFLLIGPLWLLAQLYKSLNINY